MKKFAVLLLSIMMVLSLAACGAPTPAAPEASAPEETITEREETVPAPEDTPTVEQAYAVVIGEYYTALERG